MQPTLGSADATEPHLKSFNAVLILKSAHEFTHPIPLMEKLKSKEKIGIVDQNGDGDNHRILPKVMLYKPRFLKPQHGWELDL